MFADQERLYKQYVQSRRSRLSPYTHFILLFHKYMHILHIVQPIFKRQM
jgi:hypothetical protein